MKSTPSYQKGPKNSKVAFVFSCPGRHEEDAKRPAAKATGNNLAILLQILNESNTFEFTLKREKVTIANAWDKVEYRSATQRSEATTEEVLQAENINRLANELAHVSEYIICCGEKAKIAVCAANSTKLINENCKLIFINHIGNSGLNHINIDVTGQPILTVPTDISSKDRKTLGKANTRKRMAVIANAISNEVD